jgi:DNA-binding NtrC family response regulator
MPRICLIVDDEPSIRGYLKAIFLKEDYQTLEAENAVQAFRMVQKLNGGLSLIVSDILMPGDMDGVDLAYAVRNVFPSIPVVLVTGFAGSDSVQRRLGDHVLIQKPFKPDEIRAVINRVTTH